MSRRQRGTAPQDTSPVDPFVRPYFKKLTTLTGICNTSRLVEIWKGLTYEQKLKRASNLLIWEKASPGWLERTYGPR